MEKDQLQTLKQGEPDKSDKPKQPAEEARQQKKLQRYKQILEQHKIVRFKGQALLLDTNGHYHPLTSDKFAEIAYSVHSGALVQQIRELEHITRIQAPDVSHLSHRIAINDYEDWDMRTLARAEADMGTVFRTTVAPSDDTEAAFAFMLQLADGDKALAWDMLQGIAPLFMEKKPAGVIWFVGTGANGKSALINALYKIVGSHLASLTVASIEDGRDAPRLNGMLGNVCRESSESRVDDTERYKAVGTHEPFEVHKFHSQDMITVTGDLHHIFNANNIPVFGDKTQGARRRTLIIPFPARFEDDPTFEDRTFTPAFLGGLLGLILEATHVIRDNGYRYRFSTLTNQAKEAYDSEVNSAEAFLTHLRSVGVEAFVSYTFLERAYRDFCGNEGLVPLGVTNLKRTMTTQAKVERRSVRIKSAERTEVQKWYFLGGSKTAPSELVSIPGTGLQVGTTGIKEREKAQALFEQQPLLGGDKDVWG